ncbi:MAG TPA: hypothetical protein VH371_08715 [Candidatus Limnocylindrales bacterium]|jgi:hypothetical protein
MEIQLGDERLLLLEERLTSDEVQQKAMDKRAGAFGSGIGSLLQRPKVEDINFVGRQRRLIPFWHVAATSHYVYERRHDYTVPGASAEVTAVTVYGQRLEMDQRLGAQPAFRLPLLEHCQNDFRSESFTDGLTGSSVADGPAVITGPKSEIGDVQTLEANETIVIPPEQRASFVVRKTLADVMKPVQADKILEETISLQTTDLYYRAVWAFEFSWRDKRGVIEVDSISGHTQSGKPMMAQVKGVLNRDLLFDIGADTVGLFVPGGSIAVKLAKAAIDSKSK